MQRRSSLTLNHGEVGKLMNIRKLAVILFILLLLPFTLKLKGADFGSNRSLFTDIKASQMGDILTVLIYEQSRASNQVSSKTEKSSGFSASTGPGAGKLDFIPMFGLSSDSKNSYDGKGENMRNGSLRARMSVTVMEMKPNGDLIIEGTRTIGLSGDLETLTLSGVVRQRDISPENTIDSYLIADAIIKYTGKGAINTGSRPGPITRILNWLF
jgi:flagellar L-ring protein precursor FlgH